MAHPEKKPPEKRKKRRAKSLIRKNLLQSLRILPFVLPLLITAFTYAWVYTRINIVALPIEELRKEKADLKKRNDALRLQIEQLEAPQRIEAIARQKLGMISPETWQIVVLDKPVHEPAQVAGLPEPENSSGQARAAGTRAVAADASAEKAAPRASGQPG